MHSVWTWYMCDPCSVCMLVYSQVVPDPEMYLWDDRFNWIGYETYGSGRVLSISALKDWIMNFKYVKHSRLRLYILHQDPCFPTQLGMLNIYNNHFSLFFFFSRLWNDVCLEFVVLSVWGFHSHQYLRTNSIKGVFTLVVQFFRSGPKMLWKTYYKLWSHLVTLCPVFG